MSASTTAYDNERCYECAQPNAADADTNTDTDLSGVR